MVSPRINKENVRPKIVALGQSHLDQVDLVLVSQFQELDERRQL